MRKLVLIAVLITTTTAYAEDRRIYGPNGRNVGTISTDNQGNQRFRDSRGNSTGTSSTDSQGNTTIYDSRGNIIGRTQK